MKLTKLTAAGLGAAALALLSGGAAHAQSLQVYGAGSSAVLNAALQAAVNQFPGGTAYISGNINPPSGATIVLTSGAVKLNDPSGNVTSAGTYFLYVSGSNIIFDASYDSTVGNRALFNSDTLDASGSNDATVRATVSGKNVNVGFTDIRPEDALFATNRTLSLGYSNANPVKDIFGGSFAPVAFTLSPSFTTSIGAAPVVVVVNNKTAGSDPGLVNAVNVNRYTLGNILSGNLVHVGDLVPGTAPGSSTLTTYIREPLSGTYNTMEFTEVATLEGQLSPQALTQESGVNSNPNAQPANTNSTGNPLNESGVIANSGVFGGFNGGAANGGRVRAIGTGQEVKATNTTPNALGYTFYSVGNLNPASATSASNLRYLTVDGVDPLKASYSGGTLDGGGQVTLVNVANGSYSAFSIIRAVTQGSAQPTGALNTYLTSIAGANGTNTDFIAANSLTVFRSHRALRPQPGSANGVLPNNGIVSGTEAGSDVGGAVFLKVNEQDFNADFGISSTFTGSRQ